MDYWGGGKGYVAPLQTYCGGGLHPLWPPLPYAYEKDLSQSVFTGCYEEYKKLSTYSLTQHHGPFFCIISSSVVKTEKGEVRNYYDSILA